MIGMNDFDISNLVKTVVKTYDPEIVLERDINFNKIVDYTVLDDDTEVNPNEYVGEKYEDVVDDIRQDNRILTTVSIDELCYLTEVEHLRKFNERVTDVDYSVRFYDDVKSVEMKCNTNKYVRDDIVNEPFYSPSDSVLKKGLVSDVVEAPLFDSVFENTSEGILSINEEYKEASNNQSVIRILNSSGELSECESCGNYTGIPDETDGNICIYCSDKQFEVVRNRMVHSTEYQMIQDSFKYKDCDNRNIEFSEIDDSSNKDNINYDDNDDSSNIEGNEFSQSNEEQLNNNESTTIRQPPIIEDEKVKVSVDRSTRCNCSRCSPNTIEERENRRSRNQKYEKTKETIREDDRLQLNSNCDVEITVDNNINVSIPGTEALTVLSAGEPNVIRTINNLLSKFKKCEFNIIDKKYNLVKLENIEQDELFVAPIGTDYDKTEYSKATLYDSDKNIFKVNHLR